MFKVQGSIVDDIVDGLWTFIIVPSDNYGYLLLLHALLRYKTNTFVEKTV